MYWRWGFIFILSHCSYTCLLYAGLLCKVWMGDEVSFHCVPLLICMSSLYWLTVQGLYYWSAVNECLSFWLTVLICNQRWGFVLILAHCSCLLYIGSLCKVWMGDEVLYIFCPNVHKHVLSILAHCVRFVWEIRFYIYSVPLFINMSSLYWLTVQGLNRRWGFYIHSVSLFKTSLL